MLPTVISGSAAVNTQNYALNWRHRWLERFSTSLGAYYLEQQYIDSNLEASAITGRLAAMYTCIYFPAGSLGRFTVHFHGSNFEPGSV